MSPCTTYTMPISTKLLETMPILQHSEQAAPKVDKMLSPIKSWSIAYRANPLGTTVLEPCPSWLMTSSMAQVKFNTPTCWKRIEFAKPRLSFQPRLPTVELGVMLRFIAKIILAMHSSTTLPDVRVKHMPNGSAVRQCLHYSCMPSALEIASRMKCALLVVELKLTTPRTGKIQFEEIVGWTAMQKQVLTSATWVTKD